jgi:hypothetical protein
MEIIFQAKKVFKIVIEIEKRPIAADSASVTIYEQQKMDAWDENNDDACMYIIKFLTMKVLSKITRCSTAAAMWSKLSSLHLKKTSESIFTLLN